MNIEAVKKYVSRNINSKGLTDDDKIYIGNLILERLGADKIEEMNNKKDAVIRFSDIPDDLFETIKKEIETRIEENANNLKAMYIQ